MVNKAYERQTGLNKEEVKGRLVQDLITEGVFDNALNPEIVATGKSKSCIQVNRKGRRIVLNGFPVFNEAGKVDLVITFTRDVTILSQLKEQIDMQQKLIERYQQKITDYDKHKHVEIVAESPQMKKLMDKIDRVSKTDASVLILGETGVGKDVIARLVHVHSQRESKPFFKVDCTSITESLIESELFGYAPGAFSGASSKGKPGFFELADNGTLFLDEIGELPLGMQGKLLRVLQDQEIISVGGTKIKKVNVRIVAATNRDLAQWVADGRFRSDLYYRIRVAVIDIPPLRDRKEDILPLTKYFLDKYSTKYNKFIKIGHKAEKIFLNYNWPGNIRELENSIQSLVVTNEKETIEVCDLPTNMIRNEECSSGNLLYKMEIKEGKGLNEMINEFERSVLMEAIKEFGSVAEVAKKLKVDRSTIFRKLKK